MVDDTPPLRPASPMHRAEWAMLVTLSLVWGGTFFFNGVAVRELPPLSIVAARVLLAALVLGGVLAFSRSTWPRGRTAWCALAVMGLLNNALPFTLITWAQSHIPSGVAAILNATTPLFTLLVAHRLTDDEKLTPARVIGVAIGFAGAVALIGGAGLAVPDVDLAAECACLAAAFSYACAGVFGRRFRRIGMPPLTTAAGQSAMAAAMLMPLAVVVDRPWTLAPPGAATLGAILGLATLSSAFAYVLYFRILATAGATNLLLVTFLIPASAILLGVLVLGETLSARHLLGILLIGLGLAAIDGRPWRAFRHGAKQFWE